MITKKWILWRENNELWKLFDNYTAKSKEGKEAWIENDIVKFILSGKSLLYNLSKSE